VTLAAKTPRFATGFAALARDDVSAAGELIPRNGPAVTSMRLTMPANRIGFALVSRPAREARRRRTARAYLIATIALALALVVAIAALSFGFARGETLGIAAAEGPRLALAALLGLALAGMGGVTAAMIRATIRGDRRRR